MWVKIYTLRTYETPVAEPKKWHTRTSLGGEWKQEVGSRDKAAVSRKCRGACMIQNTGLVTVNAVGSLEYRPFGQARRHRGRVHSDTRDPRVINSDFIALTGLLITLDVE